MPGAWLSLGERLPGGGAALRMSLLSGQQCAQLGAAALVHAACSLATSQGQGAQGPAAQAWPLNTQSPSVKRETICAPFAKAKTALVWESDVWHLGWPGAVFVDTASWPGLLASVSWSLLRKVGDLKSPANPLPSLRGSKKLQTDSI